MSWNNWIIEKSEIWKTHSPKLLSCASFGKSSNWKMKQLHISLHNYINIHFTVEWKNNSMRSNWIKIIWIIFWKWENKQNVELDHAMLIINYSSRGIRSSVEAVSEKTIRVMEFITSEGILKFMRNSPWFSLTTNQ